MIDVKAADAFLIYCCPIKFPFDSITIRNCR